MRDTDTVTTKTKKDGSLKSVKVNINGKDYKAKRSGFSFDGTKNQIFKYPGYIHNHGLHLARLVRTGESDQETGEKCYRITYLL